MQESSARASHLVPLALLLLALLIGSCSSKQPLPATETPSRSPAQGAASPAPPATDPLRSRSERAAAMPGQPPAPTPPHDESRAVAEIAHEPAAGDDAELAAEIQLLLDRQAEALLRKDGTAYLETLHPERRGEERIHFQHSRQVPFSEVRLELPPGSLPVAAGSRFEAPVEMTFRLEEQPADNPFVHRMTVRFALHEGQWKMNGLREEPRRPLFWRQASLALHRTHHFLIYIWPRPAREVLDVARDAEAAYTTILQRGLPLAPRYVAHLVTDERLFHRVVGSPLAVGAAASRQVTDEDGTVRVDSRSFFLNGPLLAPFRVDRPDAEERRTTIAHELVHLALSAWTRRQTPAWLVEGAAVYYSDGLDFDSNRILVRSGLEALSLPSLTATASLGERYGPDHAARAAFEYLYAGNLVEYLVRHFGNDRLLAFYGSYARPEAAISPDRARTAAALELTERGLATHFSLSLDALDQQVKENLRLRYR